MDFSFSQSDQQLHGLPAADPLLHDPTEAPAHASNPQIIGQIIGAVAGPLVGKLIGGRKSGKSQQTQTQGPTTTTQTAKPTFSGSYQGPMFSGSYQAPTWGRSTTSGSSSTTNLSGLADPSILKFVTDELPGLFSETLANIRANPYLTQAQSLISELVPTELTPLISQMLAESTPAGYRSARSALGDTFQDQIRSIAHQASAFGPSGAQYGTRATGRAAGQYADALTSAYDRSLAGQRGLIAQLIGQRTGATSEAINQLRAIDDRIIRAPGEAASTFSNILATLPLTRKSTSRTRTSSTTRTRQGPKFGISFQSPRYGQSFTAPGAKTTTTSPVKSTTTAGKTGNPFRNIIGDAAGAAVGEYFSKNPISFGGGGSPNKLGFY